MIEARIWIRVKLRAIISAIAALKARSVSVHHEAEREDDANRSRMLRGQADEADEDAEEIKRALRRVESGEDEK